MCSFPIGLFTVIVKLLGLILILVGCQGLAWITNVLSAFTINGSAAGLDVCFSPVTV